MRNPPFLLVALAAAVGCSVKVDVSDSSAAEKSRTAVALGFLVDQKSEPAPAPPVATSSEKLETFQPMSNPTPPPPTPDPPLWGRGVKSGPDQKSVTVVKNVINIKHLDIERHRHIHFYEPPKSRKKPVKVRVEVVQKHERDERCERLRREYEEKTAEWKQMMERGGR